MDGVRAVKFGRPPGSAFITERISELVLLLEERGPMTAKEVEVALGLSTRTARRHLRLLAFEGAVRVEHVIRRGNRNFLYQLVRCPCCGKRAA